MTKIVRISDCVVDRRPDGEHVLRYYCDEPNENHYIIGVTQAQIERRGFEQLVVFGGDGDQRLEKAAGAGSVSLYGDRGEKGFGLRKAFEASASASPGNDVLQLGSQRDEGVGGAGHDTYVIHPADLLARQDAPNTVLRGFDTRKDQMVIVTTDEEADVFRFRAGHLDDLSGGRELFVLKEMTVGFNTVFGIAEIDFKFVDRPDTDPHPEIRLVREKGETRSHAIQEFVDKAHDNHGAHDFFIL